MLEDRISKVKTLLEQRERIDCELAVVFGLIEQPKRGRPKKDNGELLVRSTSSSETIGESHAETITRTVLDDTNGITSAK